ncbi:MAG TPA: DUF2892 domain-containing protein [Chloroflexota bacterium]|nr:DUF2892 domain-containing protein [Chloroflexota bacterium]
MRMPAQNVGGLDRALRLVGGLVLLPAGLLLGGAASSGLGLAVAAVGLIGLVTGATGYCPTYWLFGFSTARTKHHRPVPLATAR